MSNFPLSPVVQLGFAPRSRTPLIGFLVPVLLQGVLIFSAADGTVAPVTPKLTKAQAIEQRAKLVRAARDAVQPVRHQITITKM